MTAPKKLPPHGTLPRYRLELRERAGGKEGVPCERCKAANSKARRAQRQRTGTVRQRPKLQLVDDTPGEHTPQHTPRADAAGAEPPAPGADDTPPGEMEAAFELDLADINEEDRVPFHRSLAALGRRMAKDADTAATPAARAAATKQMFEVLKSLRTRKEGDGNSALDIVLQDFGAPPVS